MPSLLEIEDSISDKETYQDYEDEQSKGKWKGPIQYKGQSISILHSPKRFAKTLLSFITSTFYVGAAFIGPPGHGKNTLLTTILHIIHTYKPDKDDEFKVPNFNIVWAGAWEFQHQDEFYASLPKRPVIIIYDDISGAINQMPEAQANKCFEALTRIRWILDPLRGHIPAMVFCLFHYSKIIPKDFRSQLQYKVYLSMGDEEQTNVKQHFDKKSRAYKKLMQYARVYQNQMEHKRFTLRISANQRVTYKTDKPFRCACAVTLSWTNFLLFPEDSCPQCAKTKPVKIVEPIDIIDVIKKQYPSSWAQALKAELYDHGFTEAVSPDLHNCRILIRKVFAEMQTDKEELINQLYKISKKPRPARTYVKRKWMDKGISDLRAKAKEITIPITETKITPEVEVDYIPIIENAMVATFDGNN